MTGLMDSVHVCARARLCVCVCVLQVLNSFCTASMFELSHPIYSPNEQGWIGRAQISMPVLSVRV